MKVVIRVDASVWIGSGHVMRCLVLADALQSHGCSVSFACLPQNGDMKAFISQRGYQVIELTPPKVFQTPKHSSDYEAWLQKSQAKDAIDFLECVRDADLVITDHYGIGKSWHDIIKAKRDCFIVAIDDLVREHNADLIVDQTLGRTACEYQTNGVALTGTKYALLNDKFALVRPQAEKRKFHFSKPKVLISMGGVDMPNATMSVLQSLVGCVEAEFSVLLSKRSPNFKVVSDWCAKHDEVHHIEFVSDMATMMLEHDVAIGAPGSTSWERACLGLPSIIIPLADNQKEICKQLVEYGIGIEVLLNEVEEKLPGAFNILCLSWEDLFHRSLASCDGKGTERVTQEIIRLNNESNYYMQ
ncbi:UDP-2,4-diacetamido-2,4,6-trideoxy-beta-L-altropyranose hydrolase [Vibrio sp. HA2012]|uniref:UDP-2,4-diacetamido-2,4, 6-trideoxy-beta-L-altropyranose hydrolase n=1 Tax=Vibrio sp. HA2012 TaxID=1971595 RepID=UPI000C2BADB1|nr:UDP-2,4-diacetamido-2,4,6-trideoxy-beta-L-altropyranose hydrolase [Vibrio sp. HA2012]PJC86299.1 UDP-2,4-diacetamido-2,4,6-trideoxy-beta-L-altropyranose hydrolase [Vibrio sp. HA2012]